MNPKPLVCPPPIDPSPKPPVSTKAPKSREKRTNPRSNPSKAIAPVKTQKKAGKADNIAVPDMPKEIKNVRQPPPSNVGTRKLVMSESSSSDESGSEEDIKGKKKTVMKPAQETTEGGQSTLEHFPAK